MTVEGIIDRLSGFFSWLDYRRWERWELMAIAIAASVTLIQENLHWAVGRARKKALIKIWLLHRTETEGIKNSPSAVISLFRNEKGPGNVLYFLNVQPQ